MGVGTWQPASRRLAPRRLVAVIPTIALAGLVLAACSSGNSAGSSSTTTTTTSPGGTAVTTAHSGGSSTTSAGSTSASKLTQFESNIQSAKGGSFKLTYAETSSATSQSSTLTFEQLPPKYAFIIGGATAEDIVDTGTGTYACSGPAGHAYCYSFSSASDPFTALLNVITGASVDTELHGIQSSLAAKLHGVQVSFSNQTFAGQASNCVSGTYQGNSFKYCVTDSGVLAYAGGSGAKSYGSLSLTSYSTSPSASDFAIPAGATIASS